jgi:L-histidine N-alpha-methyltransferase
MLEEVVSGLSRKQKELSPKYFYDARGSGLFEQITRLPEYYLTRTERTLLERFVPQWVTGLHPAALVELGAGSATKTRIILDAMVAAGDGELFVPVDVSEDFLRATVVSLREEYPGLSIVAEAADMHEPLDLSTELPRPALFALLGSTIGNFYPGEAADLLRRTGDLMCPGDAFLLGVDLRAGPSKPKKRLEEAYNDSAGVTADFNRNILRVLNRKLGADFDPRGFSHRAVYREDRRRIEMHLVSARDQSVRIPRGGSFSFREGEYILTEISGKYDRDSVGELLRDAGLALSRWREDSDHLFALALGVPDRRGE